MLQSFCIPSLAFVVPVLLAMSEPDANAKEAPELHGTITVLPDENTDAIESRDDSHDIYAIPFALWQRAAPHGVLKEFEACGPVRLSTKDAQVLPRLRKAIESSGVEKLAVQRSTYQNDGTFRLIGLTPGKYTIWAFPKNTTPLLHVVDWQGGPGAPLMVNVCRAQNPVPGTTLRVRVVNPEGKLLRCRSNRLDGRTVNERSGRCEDDGTLVIKGLYPGSWTYNHRASGFLPTSKTVVIESAQREVSMTMTMLAGLSISGTVLDESGAGVPRADVQAAPSSGSLDPLGGDLTDSEGHFTMTGLTPGEYELVVRLDDNRHYGLDGVGHSRAGDTNVILRVSSLKVITVELKASTGTLPEIAEVLLDDQINTDEVRLNGNRLELPGQLPGPHTLMVIVPGYRAVKVRVVAGGPMVNVVLHKGLSQLWRDDFEDQ